MKAVVAAFNQEKALVGAFSVITNLWMDLFEALLQTVTPCPWPGDAMESVKKVTSPAVKEIFSSMEYGPAPESDKIAARNSHSHGQRWSFTCTVILMKMNHV